jgi:2-amino-4-hydroxy-6-hydroxymethyldihydropteridine diphosphokinase
LNKHIKKDIVYQNIFLLLGSNLSNRQAMLDAAKVKIGQEEISIVKESHFYETEAWGNTDQPSFINQVIQVNTALEPQILLSTLLAIEKELGRKRYERWGPRSIDIDILYYNQEICTYANLKIPHPEIQHRRFAIEPLVEIAPQFIHPVFNISNSILLERCTDNLEVLKLRS